MNEAVGYLLPLASVVALSPLTLIAAVIITGNRSRFAFLSGNLVIILVLLTLCVQLANVLIKPNEQEADRLSGMALIALGSALVVLAGRKFATVRQGEIAGELPAWADNIERLSLMRTFLLGVVLAGVNPKNLLLMMSAATIIVSVDRDFATEMLLVIGFAVTASMVPIGIFIGMVTFPRPMSKLMVGLRSWLIQHNIAITATILLVIGLNVVGNGIATL